VFDTAVTSRDASCSSPTALRSAWVEVKCVRDFRNTQTIRKGAYRLDTPVQVVSQIRCDDARIERRKTRQLRDGCVEVHEAFDHKFCLVAAIVTLLCLRVHECDMCADKRGTGAPMGRIIWDLAYENEDYISMAELIFLGVDSGGPIVNNGWRF